MLSSRPVASRHQGSWTAEVPRTTVLRATNMLLGLCHVFRHYRFRKHFPKLILQVPGAVSICGSIVGRSSYQTL